MLKKSNIHNTYVDVPADVRRLLCNLFLVACDGCITKDCLTCGDPILYQLDMYAFAIPQHAPRMGSWKNPNPFWRERYKGRQSPHR